MYKVFINNKPLRLINSANKEQESDKILVAKYAGKQKFLYHFIDTLEKSPRYQGITLVSENIEKLWTDFQGIYKIIEAAGGVVFNAKGEVLLIYRLKTWDLPKGKIDKGETPEIAAVREIQEETGLDKVDLGDFICHTYHTYEHKGKRVLKKTHWFAMQTAEEKLTPQYSEDIELAEWRDLSAFVETQPVIYPSILEVLLAVTK
ncbi:MAG: NUDIX hydrolase [Saprospiraceae bacterium]|nr:NUDIX hydrolase [Saprospiraceae bacterium]